MVPDVSSGLGNNDVPCNTSPDLVGDANYGEVMHVPAKVYHFDVNLKLLLKYKLTVGSNMLEKLWRTRSLRLLGFKKM